MSHISLPTLNEVAQLSEPATKTEKLFDWYFERQKLVIQAWAAFLGTFLAAIVIGTLRGDYGNNWLIVGIVTLVGVNQRGSFYGVVSVIPQGNL